MVLEGMIKVRRLLEPPSTVAASWQWWGNVH